MLRRGLSFFVTSWRPRVDRRRRRWVRSIVRATVRCIWIYLSLRSLIVDSGRLGILRKRTWWRTRSGITSKPCWVFQRRFGERNADAPRQRRMPCPFGRSFKRTAWPGFGHTTLMFTANCSKRVTWQRAYGPPPRSEMILSSVAPAGECVPRVSPTGRPRNGFAGFAPASTAVRSRPATRYRSRPQALASRVRSAR